MIKKVFEKKSEVWKTKFYENQMEQEDMLALTIRAEGKVKGLEDQISELTE